MINKQAQVAMKEKLKTFKEFHKKYVGGEIGKEESICDEYAYGLKKEIIKWIKFIENDIEEMHSEGSDYHNGQIDILKIFFNIVEEDLKNGN